MFYDKKIDLMVTREGTVDEMGIHIPGKVELIRTISCDVQPYSRDLAYRDHGFSEEVSHRVYCDPDRWNDLTIGGYIEYQDKQYQIKKIIPWDGYWEVLING